MDAEPPVTVKTLLMLGLPAVFDLLSVRDTRGRHKRPDPRRQTMAASSSAARGSPAAIR